MVLIYANACEKLTKSKIGSSWESVQTLLRIACLADRKLYVIIIYANSCEKFYFFIHSNFTSDTRQQDEKQIHPHTLYIDNINSAIF